MRLPSLIATLLVAVATALLTRFPLTAVPSYESGLLLAAVSAALLAVVACLRAQSRPATAEVRWGLLAETPGEQVLRETRLNARLLAVLVALPLVPLLSVALRSECRAFAGLGTCLLMTVPAGFVGMASGTLAGTLTRSRRRAFGLLAALAAVSALDDLAEFLSGPRVVLHDFILGPLSATGYTGYDQALDFPASAYAHRAWAVIVAVGLLVLAALARCRSDAPAPAPDAAEPEVEGRDGWHDSRAPDGSRARFLLARHAVGARRALGVVAVAALPFLALHDRSGITSGRSRLERELPLVAETEHFRLHYARGSAAEAHLARLAVELEWSWRQVTGWLGTSPSWKADAWLHADDQSMFALTGARGFLFASPWRHEFHVLADRRRVRALRHELVHVLAADFGAPPFRASLSMGLTEGLATALDEGCARLPEAHEQVAAAERAGLLPPARELVSLTGFARGNMDRSYRAAASFVGWLMLERGPAPVLAAYAMADVEDATGTRLDELDEAWKRFLREQVPVRPSEAAVGRERFDPVKRPAFHRLPCARLGLAPDPESRALADLLAREGLPEQSADAYCEVPGWAHDPEVLEAAAMQRLRQGHRADALALTEAALDRLPPGALRRDPLLRQRLRLLAAQGRLDEARAAWQAWKDEGSAPFAEEPQLERQALDDDALRADYLDAVLAVPPDDVRRLAGLVERAPGFAPGLHQLLARQPPGAPDERQRLTVELAGLVPGPLAARRLLEAARTQEEALQWNESGALARRALEMPGLQPVQRLEAEDLAGRAAWAPRVRLLGPRLPAAPRAGAPPRTS